MDKPKRKINRNNWVKAKLRFASLRWPPRSDALKASRIERGLYQCAMCLEGHKVQNVILDHINPVIPLNNPLNYREIDWNDYVSRLFCEAEGFRVLCRPCDDAHTKIQDSMRGYYGDKKRENKKIDKKKSKE